MAKTKEERISYAKLYVSRRFPGRSVRVDILKPNRLSPEIWFVTVVTGEKSSCSEEGPDLDAVLDALQKKVEAAK